MSIIKTICSDDSVEITPEMSRQLAEELAHLHQLNLDELGCLTRLYQAIEEQPAGLEHFIRLLIHAIVRESDLFGEAEEMLAYLCSDDNINTRSLCRYFAKHQLLWHLSRKRTSRKAETHVLRLLAMMFRNDAEVVSKLRTVEPRTSLGKLYHMSIIK